LVVTNFPPEASRHVVLPETIMAKLAMFKCRFDGENLH
jgi:hypothetical protein